MKVVPMKVDVIDYMGSDLTVVNAARVSFDKESDWVVREFVDPDYPDSGSSSWEYELQNKDIKLIKYLADHNHWSPFAHATAQFRIKAPLIVARQLAKHQVGGVWNEVSRRYVDTPPELWMPDVWRGRPDGSIKQGSGTAVANQDMWTLQALNACELAVDTYNTMIDEGIAPEQARMVLPQNMMTEWYWTGSVMFFARVCAQRLDSHAQSESTEIAVKIAQQLQPLFPVSWATLMDKYGHNQKV